MTNLVHRFPKWLIHERFVLSHEPDGRHRRRRFTITLFDKSENSFAESGLSIVDAAKQASESRDKWNVLSGSGKRPCKHGSAGVKDGLEPRDSTAPDNAPLTARILSL